MRQLASKNVLTLRAFLIILEYSAFAKSGLFLNSYIVQTNLQINQSIVYARVIFVVAKSFSSIANGVINPDRVMAYRLAQVKLTRLQISIFFGT